MSDCICPDIGAVVEIAPLAAAARPGQRAGALSSETTASALASQGARAARRGYSPSDRASPAFEIRRDEPPMREPAAPQWPRRISLIQAYRTVCQPQGEASRGPSETHKRGTRSPVGRGSAVRTSRLRSVAGGSAPSPEQTHRPVECHKFVTATCQSFQIQLSGIIEE